MPIRHSNSGYVAIRKEATRGTPAGTPNIFLSVYEESLSTKVNNDEDSPIMGTKLARYVALQGLRSHGGDMSFLAEPNTAGFILDQILTKTGTTGAGPYTHTFKLSPTTDPNSYTYDILRGQIVHRYMGVEISNLEVGFDENKMTFDTTLAGLKSFTVREIASASGTGPTTITFKTNYDPRPTDGLVVGDIVRVYKANGTVVDCTVASIASEIAITVTENASSAVAGDYFFIRASTPSFSMKYPFSWARTEFRFGADAAAALSATQTRLEQDSTWNLSHEFTNEEGEQRSGGYDPAALARGLGDVEVTAKVYFDTPEKLNKYLTVQKEALVVRHFSETAYELRVTLNSLRAMDDGEAGLRSTENLYQELKYKPVYDQDDASELEIKVINNIASI